MSRSDSWARDPVNTSDLRDQPVQRPRPTTGTSQSVDRGGSGESTGDEGRPRQQAIEGRPPRSRESRAKHEDRGRLYSIRSSEMTAMIDVGRFRAVDIQDLNRFAYGGDQRQMKEDLASLRQQGLVEEKTVFRAHKPARKMVTLTEAGRRIAKDRAGLPKEQRIYAGFVKPRELDHDADLYKVYMKAAERIREQGGKPLRLRLDFELKESVNRAKEAGKRLSDEERQILFRAVAEEHGLTVKNTTIHLPDIQIEYETVDGRIERENLELLSRNYRDGGIRGKVAAGFTIYARTGDANRIRRALHDTGLVREVLAI